MSSHFCWGYRWFAQNLASSARIRQPRWFDSVGNVSLAHLKAWMQQPIHVLMLTMFNLFCPQLQFSHFILDNESLAALNCFYSWISPVTISQSSMAPVCARTTDMDMQLKKLKNVSHVNMAVVKVIVFQIFWNYSPKNFFHTSLAQQNTGMCVRWV